MTAPNTAVSWTAGDSETVTWDVAGTTSAPISCSQVDILISSDGGVTYPHEALTGTANDGSQAITVPGTIPTTTTARLNPANLVPLQTLGAARPGRPLLL